MVAGPQVVNINQYFMGGGMPGMGGMPGVGAMGAMPGMPMIPQQPSSMDQFMYGINSQVAMATAGPYGGSVVDWAQSLAAGQQQGMPSAAGGGSDLLVQIITMLMQAVVAKAQQNRAGK